MGYNIEQKTEPSHFEVTWGGPTQGIDQYSGETRLQNGHLPFIQNMHLPNGVPVGVDGYSPLDTGMDAEDDDQPMGAAQLIQADGTETYVQIQEDGTVNKWDASGNAWINLFNKEGSNAFFTAGEIWNSAVSEDKLIFCHPTEGNWKYDGTHWMPLGARMVADMESDEDAQWSGGATEATIVMEGEQSRSASIGAGGTVTPTFTPTSNLDLTTGNNLSKAYSKTNAKFGFFVRVSDASEFDEASSYIRVTTDGSNHVQEDADEWIDKATGSTVVFTDNTWFQIEIAIEDMTETGTFDLADVDTVVFNLVSDGGALTAYIDSVYIIYEDTMPPVRTMAVWDTVLFGGGSLRTGQDPADLHFSIAGGPDEYNALAFINIDSQDGGDITVLHRFYNQVFIGKESSCHSLGGTIAGTIYPNYGYEVVSVTTEHGADGHRGMTEANRQLWFTWRSNLYTYSGTGTQEVGDLLDVDLRDHEPSLLDRKMLVHWPKRDEIWCTYPGTGDTSTPFNVKRWRYNIKNNGFVDSVDDSAALAVGIMFHATESGLDTLVGIDDEGDWMRMDDASATDFDGTPITRTFRLPWTDGGFPTYLKYWRDLQVMFGFVTSGTITVQYRVADSASQFDSAGFTTAGTIDTDSSTDLGWIHIYDVSRWIQIQFTATAVKFDLQYPMVFDFFLVGKWA